MPDKLSSTVIIHAKHLFSKYGIPKVVISDNATEFTADTFKTFSKQWDFKHKTSSPQYPKSNEQIERTIQTIKKSIKKALKGNDDRYLALSAVRTSPGPSSARLHDGKTWTIKVKQLKRWIIHLDPTLLKLTRVYLEKIDNIFY